MYRFSAPPAGLRWLTGLFLAVLMLLAAPLRAEEDFLEPEAAFKFSARMIDGQTAEVSFVIADTYYMYRERFAFRAEGAKLGKAQLPAGKVKYDETFQKEVETYRKNVSIRIPVEANGSFKLIVTSQGCSDKGLCYAPMDSVAKLQGLARAAASDTTAAVAAEGATSPTGQGGLLGAVAEAQKGLGTQESVAATPVPAAARAEVPANIDKDDVGHLEATLKSGKLMVILPLFLLLGIGLSFTPCVLPMVPILSSIIVGEGADTHGKRGFLLAATYSLGMALVYTLFGVAAGLIGEGLAAALQNPWVLGAFALLMVVLSLSMFDVYQLQMPAHIQSRLAHVSGQQKAGKFAGVFVMGAISALIVGPCVAAPLASALVYISQTRDVVVGGGALFAMAVGMSVPLLLIGLSAGALVPRAGVWMDSVKRFFGVLMLGVAMWMVAPMLPGEVQMLGWAALGIGYGSFLMSSHASAWIARAVGIAFIIVGGVQLAGAATGGSQVLKPFHHIGGAAAVKEEVKFVRVKTEAELDAALAQAGGRLAMLDFYADWCVSCIEMEKFTFPEPRVHAKMKGMLLLQVDVTANNADDKALLKRFNLFGPPGIMFFKDGKEVPGSRVIGFQDADKFLRSLERADKPAT